MAHGYCHFDMKEIIDQLLDAEAQAESIVEEARRQRQVLINEAQEKATLAEQQFGANRDHLRAPFLKEAESRANEVVAELNRKYLERQRSIRELAAQHESEAVAAAVALILDPMQ
jgi:V/A-type H+/Na+-transporting ATPase subunit G/H